jgi:hypothetical protein
MRAGEKRWTGERARPEVSNQLTVSVTVIQIGAGPPAAPAVVAAAAAPCPGSAGTAVEAVVGAPDAVPGWLLPVPVQPATYTSAARSTTVIVITDFIRGISAFLLFYNYEICFYK